MTDSGAGGIVIVDLNTGKVHCALDGYELAYALLSRW